MSQVIRFGYRGGYPVIIDFCNRNIPLVIFSVTVIFLLDRIIQSLPLIYSEKYDEPAFYLGLDIGSVSVKCVLTDESGRIVYDVYSKTKGRPINELLNILGTCWKNFQDIGIHNIVATGSGKISCAGPQL